MSEGRDTPKAGEHYRHFKGNIYEIVCIAKNSETLEDIVVYCDIIDSSKVWTRCLENFMDSLKNPIAKPEFVGYRFTKISGPKQIIANANYDSTIRKI